MRGRGSRRVRFFAVAALMAALGLGGCSLFTPSRAEVAHEQVEAQIPADALVQEGTLTVAFDFSDAPQGMTAADGSVTGYDADFARLLAQNLGLKVSFVDAAGPSDVLSAGSADIFIGASSSSASATVTVIGDLLEDAPALFCGPSVGSTISSAGLSTLTVGVQASSAAQDALTKTGILGEQRAYGNVNECFEALASGEVDCVACDATAGAYLSRAYKGVTFAGILDSASTYGVAVPSSNSTVADAVSAALDEISSNGALDAVHAAWYGALPVSLSDEALPGVTISVPDEGVSGDEAAQTGTMIDSDVDINDLNG